MIYISLGANMPSNAGPPDVTLRRALDAMPVRGIQIAAVSAFYLTPAWPVATDPAYVNAVARASSKLGPGALLRTLLAIEKSFGRVRKTRWEPRCLDLDLLDFGGLVTDDEELSLPHPRMHERAFVLRPLIDVAPGWRHPDTGTSVAELLKIVGDEGVRPFHQIQAGA
ncbi:MAG: 2-amino-4-hydroxy-6-hydroxymethyldihydropteridine diphosphokinase [Micropepsaceae bacterium]